MIYYFNDTKPGYNYISELLKRKGISEIGRRVSVSIQKKKITIHTNGIEYNMNIHMCTDVIRVLGACGIDPRKYLALNFGNADTARDCLMTIFFTLEYIYYPVNLKFRYKGIQHRMMIQHERDTDDFLIQIDGYNRTTTGKPFPALKEVWREAVWKS